MKTLGDRIRHARTLRDLSQTSLARAASITQPTLSELETGETKEATSTTLIALAMALRVRAEWLSHGRGEMEEQPYSPIREARESPLPYTPRQDVVDVPVFEVSASMGLGAALPEYDTVVDNMRLTRSWITRNLPTGATASALAVISAYGDSMQPTFTDGDILLVDRGVSEIRLDAVYVLAFHEELYIKRIQRRRDGSIAIISDNKVYEPMIVPADERDAVRVLGRVLWAWNGKRL